MSIEYTSTIKFTPKYIIPMNLPRNTYKDKARTEAIARAVTNENRAALLARAVEENVGLVHVFDEDRPKGGLSIAFRKVSPYKSGKMVRVAIATCSKEDSFSRKTGAKQALEMFFNGKTIDLPILQTFAEEDLNYAVKHAFRRFYDYI